MATMVNTKQSGPTVESVRQDLPHVVGFLAALPEGLVDRELIAHLEACTTNEYALITLAKSMGAK